MKTHLKLACAAALMLAALLGLMIGATVRLIRGPRRDLALAGLLVGTAPLWFMVGHILFVVVVRRVEIVGNNAQAINFIG